jgi:cyclic pyranopterin phosphate synthase
MKTLTDAFGRKIDYVRLSLTDKCNMRCFYCLPKGTTNFEAPDNWLTFNEIERVISAFSQLGVKRIRLTGGEPLVRKGVAQLAKNLTNVSGIEDLSLSTNASLLVTQAQALKDAGISRINVSLDTLDSQKFADITGGSSLQSVLDGLQKAKEVGFKPIKVNMVAMKGVNDDEFKSMVDYCVENEFSLRFIETMPMGDTGLDKNKHYLDLKIVKDQLSKEFDFVPGALPGGGPAKYVKIKGVESYIGFITPISQHFCETCNRVRISVDGVLYLCLGQDDKVELRPLLRAGISQEALIEVIQKAIFLKPEKHEFENNEKVIRFMSATGG